jgi:hypothetical protein
LNDQRNLLLLQSGLPKSGNYWLYKILQEILTKDGVTHHKIVYIIRDPRDVALSTAKFVFTPFMQEQHPAGERSGDEVCEQFPDSPWPSRKRAYYCDGGPIAYV